MKYTQKLLLLAVLLLSTVNSFADGYAFIYIEGDKQTPFYVKLEGQMLPRLGMNYCILPNLDKGATKIDILFQQNKYPVQEFMVRIPETGSRAFLLERINDRQFALKDMQSGTFLIAGNKIEEDIAPEMVADAGEDPLNEELPAKTSPDGLPPFTAENEAKTLSKKAEQKQAKEEEPRFLSGIEFNVSEEGDTRPAAVSSKTTGCGEAMSNEAFERYALRIVNKEDDDAMLKELRRSQNNKCFTTEQIQILASSLETQSGRFKLVEMLYPHCSDPESYPKLEQLFNTNFLKEKFTDTVLPAKD